MITKGIADEFTEKFVTKTEKLVVGDPLSDNTDIGPLVSKNSLKAIDSIVQDTLKNNKNCQILTGGERIEDKKGYFYKPTIITNVTHDMEIATEEVFGPVAPIIKVEDEAEAIKLANDTKFGLGASIWTQDIHKAETLSKKIKAWVVSVNNVVISDPRVPFGGVKKSGFGRELSKYGMLEFANIKSIRLYDELVPEHYVE